MLPRTASRLSTDAGAVDRQKLGKLQPAPKANPNNPQDSGAASLAVEESPEPCVDGSSRDIQTGSRAENSGGVEIAGDLRAPPAELSYEGKLASDGWARGLGDEPSPDLHEGARGSGGMAAALTIWKPIFGNLPRKPGNGKAPEDFPSEVRPIIFLVDCTGQFLRGVGICSD